MSPSKIKISPSILSADPLRFGDEVRAVAEAGADMLHIDVMDGHFVPNLTYGLPLISSLKKASNLPLDVHIMVSNPDQVAADYVAAGSDILTFHVEASIHAHRTIEVIHANGAKAGISLNPATAVELIFPSLAFCDLVLVMSVNPGFGGQKFISDSLEKIRRIDHELKRLGRRDRVILQVDGGVTESNARQIIDAGADALVAGTAVFGKTDRKSAISALKNAK
jgi:ribulose-phosphate 3-epimerase